MPTAAGVERLEPETVYQHLKNGTCVLVDLRDKDRSAGLIEGAVHVPAVDAVPFQSRLPDLVRQWRHFGLVVFTCQYSAHRGPTCANSYREQAHTSQRVAILSGGFRGWEGKGLPVQHAASGAKGLAADNYAVMQGMKFAAQHIGTAA